MKVLAIGFDGASPNVIRWLGEGLPTLHSFKKFGIWGQSIPPIPAQTPVAWTTFMTGKKPGKHGIFSFAMRKKGTYDREVIGPQMLRSGTLWQILRGSGKKVVKINVPMTDVEDVKETMIPGFLSPHEGVPYPDEVRNKIKRKFGTGSIQGDIEMETLERVEADPDAFFQRIGEIMDEMAEISLYLLQEEEWDFFMPVFMGPDRIQHFFWKYIDPTHPKYECGKFGKFVKDHYIKIDKITSDFMKSIDEETAFIIVSDHGFCPIYAEVSLNNYLEESGFLLRKNGEVDLEDSRAISYGYGDIWLNVRGREPNGVVMPGEEYETTRNAIADCLKAITIDGKKPIKDVRRREEIWWGPYLNEAPDLTVFFNVGYQAARRPLIASRSGKSEYLNENPRWSGGHDGTHDPADVHGIFGIVGPGIPKEKEVLVHLWDVAPTILELMGISIPPDMDGKPIELAEA